MNNWNLDFSKSAGVESYSDFEKNLLANVDIRSVDDWYKLSNRLAELKESNPEYSEYLNRFKTEAIKSINSRIESDIRKWNELIEKLETL